MPSSVFLQLTRLFTVRDLQSPLGPDVEAGMPTAEACEFLSEEALLGGYVSIDRISLVKRGAELAGWIGFDSLMPDFKTVGDSMDPIEPGMIVTADTSVLNAVDLFSTAQRHFFFVLEDNRITGTLHYQDLFKLPFRLCLFSLTIHLEQASLELALIDPQRSWEALTSSRQKLAEDVYTKRQEAPRENPGPVDLLGCTTFCDKARIIGKRNLVPGASKKRIKAVFVKAEKIRNACAHTSPQQQGLPILERDELREFIHECTDLTRVITERAKTLQDS
jgi:hypothetical protein